MALHGILGFARPFLFWHSAKKHIITIKRHYLYCDDKIGYTCPSRGASTPPPHSLSSARFHEPVPDLSHPSIPNIPIVYWMILLCLSGAAASHTHFSFACTYVSQICSFPFGHLEIPVHMEENLAGQEYVDGLFGGDILCVCPDLF
jgi:hypothetical protein